jgi:hypothetical protein
MTQVYVKITGAPGVGKTAVLMVLAKALKDIGAPCVFAEGCLEEAPEALDDKLDNAAIILAKTTTVLDEECGPRKLPEPTLFTPEELYAAQCLWEAHLEASVKNDMLDEFREEFGAVEIRDQLGRKDILEAVTEGHLLAVSNGFSDCFDWQFVPFFYSSCLTAGEDDDEIYLVDGWRQLCMLKGDISS